MRADIEDRLIGANLIDTTRERYDHISGHYRAMAGIIRVDGRIIKDRLGDGIAEQIDWDDEVVKRRVSKFMGTIPPIEQFYSRMTNEIEDHYADGNTNVEGTINPGTSSAGSGSLGQAQATLAANLATSTAYVARVRANAALILSVVSLIAVLALYIK